MMLKRHERKQAKAGRPCKPGPRTESGQLSRAANAANEPSPDIVARVARMKIFGVTYEESRNPDLSTFIGRLFLGKELTTEQLTSLDKFIVCHAQYRSAIQVPDSLANRSTGRASTLDDEEQGKQFRKLEARYKGAVQTLVQLQSSMPTEHITFARENCILRDQQHTQCIGAIRLIANALERYWTRC